MANIGDMVRLNKLGLEMHRGLRDKNPTGKVMSEAKARSSRGGNFVNVLWEGNVRYQAYNVRHLMVVKVEEAVS